jgi:hypothetical protein
MLIGFVPQPTRRQALHCCITSIYRYKIRNILPGFFAWLGALADGQQLLKIQIKQATATILAV